MNINDFVHAKKHHWERYRLLLEHVERRDWRAIAPAEIEEFAALYRGLSADLASSRTNFPDSTLTAELNGLVSRGYSRLYTGSPGNMSRILNFISRGYPALLARNIRPLAFSVFIFLFFATAGFVAQTLDPRLSDSMVPKPLLKMFEDEIRDRPMQRYINFSQRSAFSTQLMTNNIQVSFLAFAGGVLFGAGTLYLMIVNGMLLGVLARLFYDHGRTLNFLAFIMPHGALELPAILISAAAGFIIGRSLINPGPLSRGDSLRRASLEAVRIMSGVVVLLIFAGMLEAFFTPILWIPDPVKVAFSAVLLTLLILYISTGFIRRKDDSPTRNTPEPRRA